MFGEGANEVERMTWRIVNTLQAVPGIIVRSCRGSGTLWKGTRKDGALALHETNLILRRFMSGFFLLFLPLAGTTATTHFELNYAYPFMSWRLSSS
jgi:hypothetical protein